MLSPVVPHGHSMGTTPPVLSALGVSLSVILSAFITMLVRPLRFAWALPGPHSLALTIIPLVCLHFALLTVIASPLSVPQLNYLRSLHPSLVPKADLAVGSAPLPSLLQPTTPAQHARGAHDTVSIPAVAQAMQTQPPPSPVCVAPAPPTDVNCPSEATFVAGAEAQTSGETASEADAGTKKDAASCTRDGGAKAGEAATESQQQVAQAAVWCWGDDEEGLPDELREASLMPIMAPTVQWSGMCTTIDTPLRTSVPNTHVPHIER